MSLESTLIAWCDTNLTKTLKWGPHHKLSEVNTKWLKYSSSADPTITLETLRSTGKLVYKDSCGCSGYYSGYDVYQFPNGTYRVVSCDSYTDDHDSGPIRFGDFADTKSLVTYLAKKEMMNGADLSVCCQLLLHKQIGKDRIFDMGQNLLDEPVYDPDIVMKKLDLSEDKCVDASGYLMPDLSKCDDSDVKLIRSIANVTYDEYNIV